MVPTAPRSQHPPARRLITLEEGNPEEDDPEEDDPEEDDPEEDKENAVQPTVVGLFTGLVLGLVLVLRDFGDMLVVALCGALGYVVMRVMEGELDLGDFVERMRSRD